MRYPKFLTFLCLFLCLSTTAQIPNFISTNGLIGYWPYSGNANDVSGNANNGTVTGATLTQDRMGNPNSAYHFDGMTNKIVVPYNPTQTLNKQLTFAGWVRSETTNDHQSVFLRQGQGTNYDKTWLLLMNSSNEFRVYNENSYYATFSNLNQPGDWYHLLVTINDTMATVYRNGRLIDSMDIGYSSAYSPANMIFGYAGSGNSPYPFRGDLDDIAIWNRMLTYPEINHIHASLGSNIGINVTTPQRNLHVKDVLRLEPRNSPPDSPSKGDMYFDGVLNKLRVYDGTTWQNCW
jgi:hypothetical protein